MSTILDSLKKSSEKRDDSNKSSMDNFSFSRNDTSRNSKSYVFLILLLLTIGILYFGYLYLYSDEIADTDPSSEQTLVEVETPKNENTQSAIANSPGEINKKEKPDSNDVKQRIKEIKARRKAQQESQVADANIMTNTETKKGLESNDENPAVNEVKEMLKREQQKKPEITLTMPGEISPSQAASKGQAAKVEQKHLYVYQLPFSIRKDIPKLKLNIHVYDKDPDNRIAIVNGVRFAIDDLIDDVVLVKDIIPEGVLMEFNNRVFLVPK